MNQQLVRFGVDETRQPFRNQMLAEARKHAEQGITPDGLIVLLHEKGMSIVETVWVVAQVWNLPLGQAKLQVTAHPIWAELVRATEPLHDELEKALSEPWNE